MHPTTRLQTKKNGRALATSTFFILLFLLTFLSYTSTYFNHLLFSRLVSKEWQRNEITALFCCNFTHESFDLFYPILEFICLALSLAVSHSSPRGSSSVTEVFLRLLSFCVLFHSSGWLWWSWVVVVVLGGFWAFLLCFWVIPVVVIYG